MICPYHASTSPKNLEHVIYEKKKGHVAYVTINRPEAENAPHSYAYAELRSCWPDIGRSNHLCRHRDRRRNGVLCRARREVPGQVSGAGPADAHEDPNNPLFHWGGARPAERLQSTKATDRRHQWSRGSVGLRWRCNASCGSCPTTPRSATPIRRSDGSTAHNLYEMLPPDDGRVPHFMQRPADRTGCLQQRSSTRSCREQLIAAAEQLRQMICDSSPTAVARPIRLYRLSAASRRRSSPMRVTSTRKRQRARTGGRAARLPREAQAGLEGKMMQADAHPVTSFGD